MKPDDNDFIGGLYAATYSLDPIFGPIDRNSAYMYDRRSRAPLRPRFELHCSLQRAKEEGPSLAMLMIVSVLDEDMVAQAKRDPDNHDWQVVGRDLSCFRHFSTLCPWFRVNEEDPENCHLLLGILQDLPSILMDPQCWLQGEQYLYPDSGIMFTAVEDKMRSITMWNYRKHKERELPEEMHRMATAITDRLLEGNRE